MQQLDLFSQFDTAPAVHAEPVKTVAVKNETAKIAEEKKPEPVAEKKASAAFIKVVETEKKPVAVKEKIPGKRGRKSFKEMDAEIVLVEVPEDEVLFQKQYYAISQVAKWFHVNQSLIRYWENEFSILKPRKTRKGDRLFRPEDVKNLQLIYYLLRQRKYSIEGARQYLKDNRKKADAQFQVMQSLTKFRAFLLEWKANLGS